MHASHSPRFTVVQTLSSTVVDLNQKTYQRLKAALELNLRRQIFIAVCDNIVLRDRLAAELEDDLSGQISYRSSRSSRRSSYPQLVTLTLDLAHPDPIAQVSQWLRQCPPPINRQNRALMPAFQILGIEQLSRQPASIQWLFINHLRTIEYSLPALESSLLLWVTRPWSRMIPQSAPDFWHCRTAVFDFVGEPTPFISRPEIFPMVSQSPSREAHQGSAPPSTNGTLTNGTSTNGDTAESTGNTSDAQSSQRPLHILRLSTDTTPSPQPPSVRKRSDEAFLIHAPIHAPIDEPQTDPSPAHATEDDAPLSASQHSDGEIASRAESTLVIDPVDGSSQNTDQDFTDQSAQQAPDHGAVLSTTQSLDEQDQTTPAKESLSEGTLSKDALPDGALPDGALPDDAVAESALTENSPIDDLFPHDISSPVDIQHLDLLLNELLQDELTDDVAQLSAPSSGEPFSGQSLEAQGRMPLPPDDAELTQVLEALEAEVLATTHTPLSDPWGNSLHNSTLDIISDDVPSEHVPSENLSSRSLPSDDVISEHVPSEDLSLEGLPSENLSSGSLPSDDVISEHVRLDTPQGDRTSLHTVVDAPDLPDLADDEATDIQDVTDVLLPVQSAFDPVTTSVTTVVPDVETDSDLEIFDAEPSFLTASLSSDPGLGFSLVGQTAEQRSWLDASLAEAFQDNLATDDPQAYILVQQLERLHQQKAPANVLAGAYRGLGNLYRDRVEQGDISPKNLLRAMKAYERVMQLVNDDSPVWSEVLNDIGNLCWLLSRCAPSPEQGLPHLQQGIQAYRMALTKTTAKTHPQTYPMIQNNLGAAYGDLARYHSPFDNLQKSVKAYQEALRYRKADSDPMRFASTQNNLGTTYWNLAQYRDPVRHLKQAIDAYRHALRYYQPDKDALNYAMIQNNLGTAYWNLAQHEQAEEWLRSAIEAYAIALEYRTLEVNPVAYAATQNNLGTAYWHISGYYEEEADKRLTFLRQAVYAYHEALKAADLVRQSNRPVALNFDVLATRNNLGLVQYQLATDSAFETQGEGEAIFLEQSLEHHLTAVQGWQGRPELRQTALKCVIQSLKAIYTQKGLMGQNLALSKIPGQLLPEILPQL